MNFSIKTLNAKTPLHTIKTGALVIGLFENHKLAQNAHAIDTKGTISQVLKSGDISGKPGTTLLLRDVNGISAKRLLLVGLGEHSSADQMITQQNFTQAVQACVPVLAHLGADEAVIALPFDQIKERDVNWAIRHIVLAVRAYHYRFDALKSQKDPAPTGVSKIALAVSAHDTTVAETALSAAVALANGRDLTKDLANLPGNICTPSYLADTAKRLAKEWQIKVEILERKQLEALKMGSFLSVAKGSEEEPKFIILNYQGGKAKDAPIVLVGKGITFDSGGISLKPGPSMQEMKYDMCGAASVFGTLRAVAELKLKLNIIGVIPTCENMPSGRANKPGDIVTSMSGQTIEVLNTDAEGRLILCDALTYVERFKPKVVIDIATLTGACVIALGQHNAGLFTREDAAHDQLAQNLLAASKEIDDPAWRMPIQTAYGEQLKSNVADIANIGGLPAGSVTAACFLERFTKKYTWAHLDIAGTAYIKGSGQDSTKGATGRPVPLLVTYLQNCSD